MAHTNKKDVPIAGCTERLQEMMRIMCSKRGGSLFVTDDMYCVDNGAMIVYTGLLAYANGMSTPLEESTFTQWFRTDEDGKEVHTILEYSWIQLGTLGVISQNHKEVIDLVEAIEELGHMGAPVL
ncbi:hypothetical protein CsSME_00043400 [Camellia sinensis var. sinensis]